MSEFRGFIAANGPSIPNYGERYRLGERISAAFAGSTINQMVAKRYGQLSADALGLQRGTP
ncbi:MAG: hypothetical protein ACP5VR_07650 [Acidimicrobiales bacterium]